ncbi:hypothetical protein BJX64DRAFT_172738 [Aspergillus heterothallicus]
MHPSMILTLDSDQDSRAKRRITSRKATLLLLPSSRSIPRPIELVASKICALQPNFPSLLLALNPLLLSVTAASLFQIHAKCLAQATLFLTVWSLASADSPESALSQHERFFSSGIFSFSLRLSSLRTFSIIAGHASPCPMQPSRRRTRDVRLPASARLVARSLHRETWLSEGDGWNAAC